MEQHKTWQFKKNETPENKTASLSSVSRAEKKTQDPVNMYDQHVTNK